MTVDQSLQSVLELHFSVLWDAAIHLGEGCDTSRDILDVVDVEALRDQELQVGRQVGRQEDRQAVRQVGRQTGRQVRR